MEAAPFAPGPLNPYGAFRTVTPTASAVDPILGPMVKPLATVNTLVKTQGPAQLSIPVSALVARSLPELHATIFS
jgi:hypothetical protein